MRGRGRGDGARSSKGPDTRLIGGHRGPRAGRRGGEAGEKTHRALGDVEAFDADDHELPPIVARAQAGDDIAFAELYVRLFDRVYRYLRLALKSDHDAQEIAQDVFAKLLVALPGYNPMRGPFRTWLFAIVRNMTIDHLRKAGRSDATDPHAMRDYMPTLSQEAVALQLRFDPMLDIAGIVDALPEAQRRVVALRFLFDLTPTEIGTVLGATPDAVRHTLHRALKAIATGLEATAALGPS